MNCVANIPRLNALVDKYADKGLAIAAPSLDAEDEIKAFQTKHRMNYAVLSDAKENFDPYGVDGLPALYIVDKNGKIAWRGGSEDDPGFAETLEKALK